MATRSGRGRLGCLGAVILVVLAYAADYGFDAYVAAPWAYGIGGRPTLTGPWAGTFDGPNAPTGVVWLDIARGSGGKRRGIPMLDFTRMGGHPMLHGTAVWCRGDGSVGRYRIFGWASKAGEVEADFTVSIPPTHTATELQDTHGHWHDTTLTLTGALHIDEVSPSGSRLNRPTTIVQSLSLHATARGLADSSCVSAHSH